MSPCLLLYMYDLCEYANLFVQLIPMIGQTLLASSVAFPPAWKGGLPLRQRSRRRQGERPVTPTKRAALYTPASGPVLITSN